MEKFDLEKALAGEPVALRNGKKAFVKFVMENPACEGCAMIGYFVDYYGKNNNAGWYKNGLYLLSEGDGLDIIGMWEEVRPTTTMTLPCPLLTAHHNQEVFKIGNVCITQFHFDTKDKKHRRMLENGSLFYSKSNAEAWADAMANARR
ncbi:TPA: pyruvate kinase [Pasteurella multocida]